MEQRRFLIRLGTLVGLFLFGVLLWLVQFSNPFGVFGSGQSEFLSVTFLDIGQGDSILIQTPDGVQMLIDGGPDGTVLRRLSKELPWFDRTIDVVLGTHPDKDHIGGLVDVLKNYQVANIITTENRSGTGVDNAFADAFKHEDKANIIMARAGQVFMLGASTTVTIFSPDHDPTGLETNTSSIVAKVSYGNIDFMLTGDAPISIEEYLVRTYGPMLSSEVLKLGHHGSRTSSSDDFLNMVHPNYAVVSAGKNNTYGHPHKEVVDAVLARNIKLVSTIDKGDIQFTTDGIDIWKK
jgi:competence protein ComEC